ncbi:hypothetical protein C8Q74DRAFT_1222148 [Fomes fomentarius]|nr:hypothetical protein C8Q74DRAFT_1222148 [Fomes fomentarius]
MSLTCAPCYIWTAAPWNPSNSAPAGEDRFMLKDALSVMARSVMRSSVRAMYYQERGWVAAAIQQPIVTEGRMIVCIGTHRIVGEVSRHLNTGVTAFLPPEGQYKDST